jgi:hypothetical protein
VILHRQERKWVEFDIVELVPADPAAAFEVTVDGGRTWHAAGRAGSVLSVLLAGPDAETAQGAGPNPEGTVVVPYSTTLSGRLRDDPEIEIEPAGAVFLIS